MNVDICENDIFGVLYALQTYLKTLKSPYIR